MQNSQCVLIIYYTLHKHIVIYTQKYTLMPVRLQFVLCVNVLGLFHWHTHLTDIRQERSICCCTL